MIENPKNRLPITLDAEGQIRQRNATRITLATFVLMLMVAAVNAFLVPNEDKTLIDNYTMPFMAVSAGLSYVLVRRGSLTPGILTLLASTFLIASIYPFVADNVGWQAAIGMMLITTTIANVTLPSRTAGRVTIAAFLLAMLIIVIELYIPGVTQNAVTTSSFVITSVLSIIYIAIILARFRLFSLRTKMAVVFIGIALLAVLPLGFQSTAIMRNNITEQVSADLVGSAKATAGNIDLVLENELNAIRTEAQISDFVSYLSLPANQRATSVEQARALIGLLGLQSKNPEYIVSYALLDRNGTDVLDTIQEDIGVRNDALDYLTVSLESGEPYISPVVLSQTTGENSIYFTAPVHNLQGEIIGLLRSRYHAAFLQDLLNELFDAAQEEEYAVVLDNGTFLRIAHTGNPDFLFKSYASLSADQVRELQESLRLPPGTPDEVTIPEPDVMTGLANIEEQPVFIAPSQVYGGESAFNSGARVSTTNWTVLVSRTERSALAPVKAQTRSITIASLAVILFAAVAGSFASQILARPLVQLAGIVKEITDGNLDARAKVQLQDEIGTLADSFNHMTNRLQETLGGLEKRIAERTVDLEISRRQSEKRATELQTIGEISSIITGEQNIETLLPLVTRLVSERFGFYHVGIFLIDETGQFAVLQAANSEGGQKMLARGHKLEVGTEGIVGYVAKNNEPRIALDVGTDAVFFDNPDLPATRSEMALPLNSRGQTIGALDVQSDRPGAFAESDAQTLSILADQVSTVIENARLFDQTQHALSEAQALYSQYVRESWGTLAKEESLVGYHQSMAGGRKLIKPVDTEDIRDAMHRGRLLVLHADGNKGEPTIVVPVKLRGQIIGVLNIKAPSSNRQWSQDEIDLAEAISERLSLALENARLFEETTRRAERERLVSDITTKIRSTNDPQEMIKTAVMELKRALGATRVEIIPQKSSLSPDK